MTLMKRGRAWVELCGAEVMTTGGPVDPDAVGERRIVIEAAAYARDCIAVEGPANVSTAILTLRRSTGRVASVRSSRRAPHVLVTTFVRMGAGSLNPSTRFMAGFLEGG